VNLRGSGVPAIVLCFAWILPGSAADMWRGTYVKDIPCADSDQRVEVSFDYQSLSVRPVYGKAARSRFLIDLPSSDNNRPLSTALFCRYSGEPPKDKDVLYLKLQVAPPERALDSQPALLRVKKMDTGNVYLLYVEPVPGG
jgi:hypothetical protein